MKHTTIAALVIAVAAISGVTAQETWRQANAPRTPQQSKYLETGGERKLENSGHNWRKVDAEIEPGRTEIIERTINFFVDHIRE